jgi:hypothetical protein
MATTYTGGAGVNFNYTVTQAAGFNAAQNLRDSDGPSMIFGAGQAAGQISQAYSEIRTFSGSTDSRNLGSGGGLVDLFGNVLSNARLKMLYVSNIGANNLVLGGGSNPILTLIDGSGNLHLPPGAFFLAATPDGTGWALTPTTAVELNFTGTSGQQYRVAALGCSS